MATEDRTRGWMRQALALATEGLASGEAPIGSVLVREDGQIAGSGYNSMHATGNVTLHAEMVALASSAGNVAPGTTGLTLVSTLEPCVMCTGAAMEAGVEHIIFGLPAPADAGTNRVRPPETPSSTMPTVTGGIMASQSRQLFVAWMDRHGADPSRALQRAFIQQLLGLTMRG